MKAIRKEVNKRTRVTAYKMLPGDTVTGEYEAEFIVSTKSSAVRNVAKQIEDFACENEISNEQMQNIRLVLETAVIYHVLKRADSVRIAISGCASDDVIEIRLSYGGSKYDPFDEGCENTLSDTLIGWYADQVTYTYENENILIFKI